MQSKNIRDSFKAYMVKNHQFEGKYDIPICSSNITKIPKKIITFSEAKEEIKKDYPNFNATVCFYKDDYKFDSIKSGIWNNPYKWVPLLSKFDSVIEPDFSTYQDFPMALKIYNIYRMRAVGCFLQNCGIPIISNYRSGTYETFEYCTDGIKRNSIVCIGTHGFIKHKNDQKRLMHGLNLLINKKNPSYILFYGSIPKDISDLLNKKQIPFKSYKTDLKRRIEGAKN